MESRKVLTEFILPWILAASANTEADVVLHDGDQLLTSRHSQIVTIIGEVQFPTSHIYEPHVGRNDYIERSGGFAFNADKKRIHVVRANGSVVPDSGSRFFRGRGRDDIQPADTIVVPLDADHMSRLTFWTNVSTIIFNIGIVVAATASF